ncbi:MAG: hypothetical protein AB7U73_23930 [Pirellulales bacterium]
MTSNLYDGKAKLRHAAQKLRLAWEEAQTGWNDAVSRDFERDYLDPLEPRIAAALRAIDQLGEVLTRAEQECSQRDD